MMGWYHGSGFGTSWMLMGVFWVLLAVALGALVVWLLARGRAEQVDPTVATRSALETLDRRFALGEIDTDAYRAQRAALLTATPVTR